MLNYSGTGDINPVGSFHKTGEGLKEEPHVKKINTSESMKLSKKTQSTSVEDDESILRQANDIISKAEFFDNKSEPTDEFTQRILRAQYVEQLSEDLVNIIKKANNPSCSIYISSFLKTVKTMRKLSPFDPYLEIIIAFTDAILYKNKWADFSPDQFKKAKQILISYANRNISSETALKGILELEEAGFDTTPFEISFEDDQE